MSFRRHQDKHGRRSSRTMNEFAGRHGGTGRTDQPPQFADSVDFDFVRGNMRLRAGCRKNERNGYDNTITAVFPVRIGGLDFLGMVEGGNLSVIPMTDLQEQIRQYYTWQELQDNFTWATLDDNTWRTYLEGRR